MNRLIRSLVGMLVGIVVFVLSVSLTLLVSTLQIVPIAIDPLVLETACQDPVILTVMNHDGGMVCNNDEYLRLRVYLSGRIESDSFDNTESCRRERKTAVLDDVRLANLRRTLENRDLLKCKNEYPQSVIYVDTYTYSVMTFEIGQEEKRIALTNPAWNDPRNIANYPKTLIELLREVDEMTEHFEFR